MKHQIDPETRQLIDMFVAESIDALDSSEPLVENLAKSSSGEDINAIFRVFHTIKGLSGFVNFPVIHAITHEAETLLDIFRKKGVPEDPASISLIYSIFDFLRNALVHIGAEYSETSYEAAAGPMTDSIRAMIGNESQGARKSTESGGRSKVEPDSGREVSTQENTALVERLFELVRAELAAMAKCKDYDHARPAILIAELHEALREFGHEDEELAQYWDNVENLASAVSGGALILDQGLFTIISSDLLILKYLIVEKAAEWDNEHQVQMRTDGIFNTGGPLPDPPDDALSPEESLPAASIPEASAASGAGLPPAKAPQRSDIRVQTEKLDRLFDLVGEMITLQSMVINNPDLEGMELPNFSKACNMLDKVTRELQEVTMSIRMTPLEGLFNKMKRLVRDTALKMDKQIILHISGQETEMDKNIIEEIADPLMHILRNAVDHGIENTNERLAAGKEATGTISLSARYEANQIRIDIGDDGAGLNREKILARAQKQGILRSPQEKLSEREVYALIFEPGFSTAEQITAVSGRGVGMDVVRKNIEKLHGSVQVESEPGRGTRIILRIPLTLAIMDAMLISVGEAQYALPMQVIRESFRPQQEDITVTMDGLEVVRVRDELFPVLRLHEMFGRVAKVTKLEEGILMVVESGGQRACLFVDQIIGQQQAVVKGLSEYIGKVQGVTGCMILGNGEIGLILDVENILQQSRTPETLQI